MPTDEEKATAILVAEAAGKLSPEQQEGLNHLRKSGQFPTVHIPVGDPFIDAEEDHYGLPKGMLHAVRQVESGGRADAVSPTGVTGDMQITMATGAPYGLTELNRTNPYKSIDVAAQILANNLKESKGDVVAALKAYGDHNETGYADKVLKHWTPQPRPTQAPYKAAAAGQPAAPPAAPVETPQPEGTSTTDTPTTTEEPGGTAERFLRNVVGHTVLTPAADFNSFAHKFGLSFLHPMDPLTARHAGLQYGTPGAADWPSKDPEGILATTGAALAPTEALWPQGALAWSSVATLTNKRFADTVEGALGLFETGRGAMKTYRALRGRTPNEVAHLTAVERSKEAADAAADAKAAHAAVEGRIIEAEDFHRAAQERIDSEIRSQPSTASAVRDALNLQGANTGETSGRILQANPNQANELLPGAQAGVQAGMSRHLAVANKNYEAVRVMGDQQNIILSPHSADHLALLDAVDDYVTHGGSESDGVVRDIRNLGLVGLRDIRTGEVRALKDPKQIEEALASDPNLERAYGPITYRAVSEMYARLANMAPTPAQYASSTDRGARAFYRLTRGTLKLAMEKLEQVDPAMRDAATVADRHYRDVVVPYRRTTKALTGAATEPAAAFDKLVSNPASMLRYFDHATEIERNSHRAAFLDGLVRKNTNALGDLDYKGLLKDWNNTDETVRDLVSSGSSTQAGRVLDQWVARSKKLDDAQADLKAFKSSLTIPKRRALKDARDDVTTTLKALSAAKAEAKRTGALPVGKAERAGRLHMPFIGRMHAVSAVVNLLHGNYPYALLQGGLAAMWLRRPKLVAEALKTPLGHPNYPMVAAALRAAAIELHLAPPDQQEGAPQTPPGPEADTQPLGAQ
jgi:hypothetical protein